MFDRASKGSVVFALFAAALVASTSGCSTCASSARFAELGNGSFAGIAIDTYGDLPPSNDFHDAWDADEIGGWSFDTGPQSLTVKGLPEGEVESFCIEFAPVDFRSEIRDPYLLAELERDPELILNPDLREELEGRARAMAVIATPRWSENLEEDTERFGFELRDLAALTEHGPVFRTSNEDWLAILECYGDRVRVKALAAAYDPEFFRYGNRSPIEDLDRQLAADPKAFMGHSSALETAVRAGSPQAVTILARLEEAAELEAGPRLAAIAAELRSAPDDACIGLVRNAVAAMLDARNVCGRMPTKASAAFELLRADASSRLAASAEKARAQQRLYEADGFEALRACVHARSDPSDLGGSLEKSERVLSCARELDGLKLVERIHRHGELQKDVRSGAMPPIEAFAALVRIRLSAELEESARAASADDRHATACCRHLLAHGVRHGASGLSVGTTTLEAVQASSPSADESALDGARREAALLAAKVLPFVHLGCAAIESCAQAYDEGGLLAGVPLATRLGLATGDRVPQARFALDVGAELLTLEISDPEIAVERADRRERGTETRYRSDVVANPALADWSDRMRTLAARLDSLSSTISTNTALSQTVTGTLGFTELKYVSSTRDSTTYEVTRPYELASSILARGEAAGKAADASDEYDRVYREYKKVEAEQPPEQVLQTTSYVIEYPREVQAWKIHVSRTARLQGEKTRHEVTAEQDFELNYLRVNADPSRAIAGVDEWRTEQELLGDRALFDAALPSYARLALGDLLESRLNELDAQIHERGFEPTDEITERRWLYFLFHDPSRVDDADLLKVLALQQAVIDSAFAGDGDPPPSDALASAPIEASTDAPAGEPDARATADGAPTFQEMFDAAKIYWDGDDYGPAEALFGQCVAVDPSSYSAWVYLAGSRCELRDYPASIEAYENAVALRPQWTAGRLMIAILHALRDDWSAASAAYDSCLPDASADDVEFAIAFATRKLEKFPDHATLPKAIGRLRSQK